MISLINNENFKDNSVCVMGLGYVGLAGTPKFRHLF